MTRAGRIVWLYRHRAGTIDSAADRPATDQSEEDQMFDHTCTVCARRWLIAPGQITSLTNTDHGIVVAFVCGCGAEQHLTTGRRRPRGAKTPVAA